MIDANSIRHPKEQTYFTIMAIFSVILYLCLIPLFIAAIFALPVFLLLALIYWWRSLIFKARVYGNCVHVSTHQYPKIHEIVQQQVQELGLSNVPPVFIMNGNGEINALAIKIFGKRYVILNASLVDVLLAGGELKQLAMIIGHELGHHAAGHLNIGRTLLTSPARIIPFISAAYSRACELTADRIGYALIQDEKASKNALVAAVALGSWSLASQTNIDTFKMQETQVPPIAGFFSKLFDSHPRATRRIMELEAFGRPKQSYFGRQANTDSNPSYISNAQSSIIYCPSCSAQNSAEDNFCNQCGSKLK